MNGVVFDNVTKWFAHRPALFNWISREREGRTVALNEVSFSVQAGSIMAVLGPNGSGKTTILKLISTMLLPDSGQIFVHGHDTATAQQNVRARVGFAVASERSFFPRLTARENLDFFATLDDVERADRAERVRDVLKTTELEDVGDTLVMKFSSGMYQRLAIARALLKEPSVLLLDEPSRSLDPAAAYHFWEWLKRTAEQGCAVLLATHNFDEAITVASSVAILSHGRILTRRPVVPEMTVADLRQTYFGEIRNAAALEAVGVTP